LPGAVLPEFHETQDLVVLKIFAQRPVGVAKHPFVGILGEEGEHTLLSSAAFGDVVFLNQGVVAMIGDGVEIQVE
jgi:hypothetical protein